jgi:catechol 2,3-dioxygenase-like lactoylglutathione lyase family enzyme
MPARGRGRGMLRFGMVVIGAHDMDRAERFWCTALGYEERYRQDGGDWRELQSANGSGSVIGLQRSDAHPRHDPRLHIDLEVDSAAEQRAEIGRLTGLGARLADWDHYPADPGFVVLEDTEGNKFCIVDASH